eukprot:5790329-Prymnesium_polylepis.1
MALVCGRPSVSTRHVLVRRRLNPETAPAGLGLRGFSSCVSSPRSQKFAAPLRRRPAPRVRGDMMQ